MAGKPAQSADGKPLDPPKTEQPQKAANDKAESKTADKPTLNEKNDKIEKAEKTAKKEPVDLSYTQLLR